MYKIRFEFNSINLTTKEYENLPELSPTVFNENCEFNKGLFVEKVRHPEESFPAIWITNDDWVLEDSSDSSGGYLDDTIKWVFVCLDVNADIWIAFKYYDAATVAEAYGSTVSVSFPCHGEVYRLDSKCKEIVRKFY